MTININESYEALFDIYFIVMKIAIHRRPLKTHCALTALSVGL